MVISSEHLSSRLFTDAEMERLHGLLVPFFDQIDVVVYLRDPLEAAISLLSTAVKSGDTSGVLPGPPVDWGTGNERSWISVCDHRQMLQRWERFFAGKVRVRLFEPTFMREGSIISDFSYHLEVSSLTSFEQPVRSNESLSATGAMLLVALNRRFQSSNCTISISRQREITSEVIASMSGRDKILPTPEQTAQYHAAFAESFEWVRSRYFPERSTLFSETRSKTSEACAMPPTKDIDAIADLIVSAWETGKGLRKRDEGIISRFGRRLRKVLSF